METRCCRPLRDGGGGMHRAEEENHSCGGTDLSRAYPYTQAEDHKTLCSISLHGVEGKAMGKMKPKCLTHKNPKFLGHCNLDFSRRR